MNERLFSFLRAACPPLVFVLTVAVWSPAIHAQPHEGSERPNIVVLLADDLGYGDLGSYGHPTIRTPRLDSMASEGIRFTSFYAAPACTPARASLLTGRYAVRSGLGSVIMPAAERGLRAEEVTLAETLKAEGYRTMAIGKWHLGHARPEYLPTAQGFDDYFGLIYSNDMIRPWVQTDRPLALYRGSEPVEHPVDQTGLTVRYTDEAVRFIEESEEPFLLYMAYSMPHLPIYAAEERRGLSRAGLYGDVIETIDWSVGRILDALDDRGLAENTVVVFTSDNGPWLDPGERMLQGGVEPWDVGSPGLLNGAKGMTYEGGVRVPAVIRWQRRIPAGQTTAEMATVMDLFVTLTKAAGAQVPMDRPIDGNDLQPLLEGRVAASPTQVFYYFAGNRLEGVREGPWKLRKSRWRWENQRVQVPEDEAAVELFNLDVDPSERYNVAGTHPDIIEHLESMLDRFAGEVSP